MSLTDKINEDVKKAMKEKDKDTLKVIRMLKSALQMEQLKQKDPLTKEQETAIIAREMKQRKESLAEFEKADRDDLIADVKKEILIVEQYLPNQLSEPEVEAEIKLIIDETGASSPADFGKVMGQAMAKLRGQADGQLVNEITKRLLNN